MNANREKPVYGSFNGIMKQPVYGSFNGIMKPFHEYLYLYLRRILNPKNNALRLNQNSYAKVVKAIHNDVKGRLEKNPYPNAEFSLNKVMEFIERHRDVFSSVAVYGDDGQSLDIGPGVLAHTDGILSARINKDNDIWLIELYLVKHLKFKNNNGAPTVVEPVMPTVIKKPKLPKQRPAENDDDDNEGGGGGGSSIFAGINPTDVAVVTLFGSGMSALLAMLYKVAMPN